MAYKIWNKIKFEKVSQADLLYPEVQNRRHGCEAEVRGNDPIPLLRFEKRRGGLEVLQFQGQY